MEWNTNDNHPSSMAYSSNIVNQYTAMTGARLEFGYDYMGRRVFKKVRQGDLLVKHLIFAYEPFGQCRHAGASTSTFRFSSEYHDNESGLVYYNYRHYSPNPRKMDQEGPSRGGRRGKSVWNGLQQHHKHL